MATKKYQLENYRKFLLNRVTSSSHILEYIENCLGSEDEAAQHSFHKVMIHNWNESDEDLFETLSEYFSPTFIPVNYTSHGAISTFYTSSLSLILKIVKLDFMFPHQRNMYNIDILFNDKSSADCFENRVTVENIIASVVSNRMSDKFELDLSDISSDPEFINKKIHVYKLGLLAQFKILMLRMGRDTKVLNLSNNNLSQVPVEILNFFIKGDLVAINLSDNNIPSLSELQRISSKIEKLWIEGNPLCEELDPVTYVKYMVIKFPRLTELDGIRLNENGMALPFLRNYLSCPDKKTKMLTEKFLSLYFSHYDCLRDKIGMFYDVNAKLSISTSTSARCSILPATRPLLDMSLPGFAILSTLGRRVGDGFNSLSEFSFSACAVEFALVYLSRLLRHLELSRIDDEHYVNVSRNVLIKGKPRVREQVFLNKIVTGRNAVMSVLASFPDCVHDPSTFNTDVLKHDKKTLVIVVDGIFKETRYNSDAPVLTTKTFQFRRTFIFKVTINPNNTADYFITNEMFSLFLANNEQMNKSFKDQTTCTNPMALRCPDAEDSDALCNVFSHLTQLKKPEAELRLQINSWDIGKALTEFLHDMSVDKISSDRFIEEDEDDFSDLSSLDDDDID